METKHLSDAIVKIGFQLEEMIREIAGVRAEMKRIQNEDLNNRITNIERLAREHSTKLDALNAIDIVNPTIITTQAPAKVSVVTAATDEKSAPPPVGKEEPKHFGIINEFFKYMFINQPEVLVEKKIIGDEEMKARAQIKSTATATGRKRGDAAQQKSLATTIWKKLAEDKKEIVKALKVKMKAEYQKNGSVDIKEED